MEKEAYSGFRELLPEHTREEKELVVVDPDDVVLIGHL